MQVVDRCRVASAALSLISIVLLEQGAGEGSYGSEIKGFAHMLPLISLRQLLCKAPLPSKDGLQCALMYANPFA